MNEDSELNEHLRDEIERLRQRIKRLEEAGDAMVLYATTPTKTAWNQAKEAKL